MQDIEPQPTLGPEKIEHGTMVGDPTHLDLLDRVPITRFTNSPQAVSHPKIRISDKKSDHIFHMFDRPNEFSPWAHYMTPGPRSFLPNNWSFATRKNGVLGLVTLRFFPLF